MSGQVEVAEPSLLRNRSFILLWLGKLTSSFGDRITYITVTWWVLQTLGRPEVLGAVMVAVTLPVVFVSPLSGIVADRVSRKQIIVWTDVGRGLVLLSAAVLMALDLFSLGFVLAGCALTSTLSSLFNPAASAIVPNLVPPGRLLQANSLIQVNLNLTGLIGPAVGGMLLAVVGVQGCFVAVGLSYLLSALSEAFIIEPPATGPPPRSVLGDLKDTVKYLAMQPVLRGMAITFSVLNFFMAPIGSILLPTAITVILGLGAVELGLSMSMISAGVVASALCLSVIGGRIRRRAPGAVAGIVTVGASFGLMGLLVGAAADRPWVFWPFLGLCLIVGVGSSVSNVNISSHLQHTVPDERRGRTFGLLTTVSHGLQPLSMGVVALVLTWVGVPSMMAACGFFIVLGGLYLLLIPGFRRI